MLIWHAEANGKFSTKSAYHLARMHGDVTGGETCGSVLDAGVKFLWKAIWRSNVPEEVKKCVWRCCLNALPTRLNLRKKKILMETSCLFCDGEEETIDHILRDCPRSRAIWFASPLGSINRGDRRTKILEWLEVWEGWA